MSCQLDCQLVIRQQKTGTVVEIPVLAELQAELDMLPGDQLTFLVTEQGRPFAAAGFGNWFRDMAAGAGLPTDYNSHGLRKAGATRGAEAGWTDHEIMAWGGWKSLSEVQRYTRAANRRKSPKVRSTSSQRASVGRQNTGLKRQCPDHRCPRSCNQGAVCPRRYANFRTQQYHVPRCKG